MSWSIILLCRRSSASHPKTIDFSFSNQTMASQFRNTLLTLHMSVQLARRSNGLLRFKSPRRTSRLRHVLLLSTALNCLEEIALRRIEGIYVRHGETRLGEQPYSLQHPEEALAEVPITEPTRRVRWACHTSRVTAACSLDDCTSTTTLAEKRNTLYRNQLHVLGRAWKRNLRRTNPRVPLPVAHCRTCYVAAGRPSILRGGFTIHSHLKVRVCRVYGEQLCLLWYRRRQSAGRFGQTTLAYGVEGEVNE